MAFHDSFGGLDGRIDTSSSEHNGLLNAYSTLSDLYDSNTNLGLGRSDFFAWTYVAAFYMSLDREECGDRVPWVVLSYGRADVDDGAFEDVPPGGAFGSFDHALNNNYFEEFYGFTARDTALIMGAHTLGAANLANTGFVGRWTSSPNAFNNEYYRTMVNPPSGETQWEQVEVGTDKHEWRWGCDASGNGCQDLMLNVDMSLLFDITYNSVGKAVLPSGSSCTRLFDDCWPMQTSGAQEIVDLFDGDGTDTDGEFRNKFAVVYARMINRVKTSSSLTYIESPDNFPAGLDSSECECFSKSTTVNVEDRGLVEMQYLQVGDHIWTGKSFEPVYAFGHRHEDESGKFLTIHTADTNQQPLEITAGHMVFKEESGSLQAIPAKKLKVGDTVQTTTAEGAERSMNVTKISSVRRKGLYMPLTPSGKIMVNGILASTYVSIENTAPVTMHDTKYFPFISVDKISHWWMSPYRLVCLGVSSNLCKNPTRDGKGILQWFTFGKSFAEFVNQQSFFVRVFVMGVPMFLVFGVFILAEAVLGGPSLAPLAVMAIVTALVWVFKSTKENMKGKQKIA